MRLWTTCPGLTSCWPTGEVLLIVMLPYFLHWEVVSWGSDPPAPGRSQTETVHGRARVVPIGWGMIRGCRAAGEICSVTTGDKGVGLGCCLLTLAVPLSQRALLCSY